MRNKTPFHSIFDCNREAGDAPVFCLEPIYPFVISRNFANDYDFVVRPGVFLNSDVGEAWRFANLQVNETGTGAIKRRLISSKDGSCVYEFVYEVRRLFVGANRYMDEDGREVFYALGFIRIPLPFRRKVCTVDEHSVIDIIRLQLRADLSRFVEEQHYPWTPILSPPICPCKLRNEDCRLYTSRSENSPVHRTECSQLGLPKSLSLSRLIIFITLVAALTIGAVLFLLTWFEY